MTKSVAIIALLVSTAIMSAHASQCAKPDLEKIIMSKQRLNDPTEQKGCVLTQNCRRDPGDPSMKDGPCPHGSDPTVINNP